MDVHSFFSSETSLSLQDCILQSRDNNYTFQLGFIGQGVVGFGSWWSTASVLPSGYSESKLTHTNIATRLEYCKKSWERLTLEDNWLLTSEKKDAPRYLDTGVDNWNTLWQQESWREREAGVDLWRFRRIVFMVEYFNHKWLSINAIAWHGRISSS